jgi:antitoxin component HigA of HigAB toxin-antitoxin module
VKKIANEADYKSVMAKINKLMSKGSEKVSKTELAQIRKLALVVQQYEQTKFSIKASTTLEGIDNGDFLLNAI